MEYRTKNMVWVCYHWRWIRSGFRSVEGDALAVAGKDLLRSLFAWDSTGHWAKLFEVRSGWVMSPRSHQKWWFVKVTMAKMARVFQSVEFLWFSQIIRNDKRSPKNSPDIAKLTVFDWSRSMFGRFWQVVFRNSYFRVLYTSTYIYIIQVLCPSLANLPHSKATTAGPMASMVPSGWGSKSQNMGPRDQHQGPREILRNIEKYSYGMLWFHEYIYIYYMLCIYIVYIYNIYI